MLLAASQMALSTCPRGSRINTGPTRTKCCSGTWKGGPLIFSLSEYDSFGFAAVEAASRQCMPVFRAGSIQETMFSESAAMFLNDSWTPRDCVAAIDDKLGLGAPIDSYRVTARIPK